MAAVGLRWSVGVRRQEVIEFRLATRGPRHEVHEASEAGFFPPLLALPLLDQLLPVGRRHGGEVSIGES